MYCVYSRTYLESIRVHGPDCPLLYIPDLGRCSLLLIASICVYSFFLFFNRTRTITPFLQKPLERPSAESPITKNSVEPHLHRLEWGSRHFTFIPSADDYFHLVYCHIGQSTGYPIDIGMWGEALDMSNLPCLRQRLHWSSSPMSS